MNSRDNDIDSLTIILQQRCANQIFAHFTAHSAFCTYELGHCLFVFVIFTKRARSFPRWARLISTSTLFFCRTGKFKIWQPLALLNKGNLESEPSKSSPAQKHFATVLNSWKNLKGRENPIFAVRGSSPTPPAPPMPSYALVYCNNCATKTNGFKRKVYPFSTVSFTVENIIINSGLRLMESWGI